MSCIFCSIVAQEIPVTILAQNEYAIAFNDRSPQAPIHILVIPKKHIVDINAIEPKDKELVWGMMNLVQQISADFAPNHAFNLISNNGADAGQSVLHMHWHVLAGKNIYNNGFSL